MWLEHPSVGPYLVQFRDRGGASEKQSFHVLEVSKLFETRKTMPIKQRNPLHFGSLSPLQPPLILFWYTLRKRFPNNDVDPDGARAHTRCGPAIGYLVGARPKTVPLRAGSHKGTTARYYATLPTLFAYYCPLPVSYTLWRCLEYYHSANGPATRSSSHLISPEAQCY